MTVAEAIKIALEENKDSVILCGTEYENWFTFVLGNKKGEAIGNSSAYAIRKDGKEAKFVRYDWDVYKKERILSFIDEIQ